MKVKRKRETDRQTLDSSLWVVQLLFPLRFSFSSCFADPFGFRNQWLGAWGRSLGLRELKKTRVLWKKKGKYWPSLIWDGQHTGLEISPDSFLPRCTGMKSYIRHHLRTRKQRARHTLPQLNLDYRPKVVQCPSPLWQNSEKTSFIRLQ